MNLRDVAAVEALQELVRHEAALRPREPHLRLDDVPLRLRA